jgi:uncharacterized protein with GYD domain
MKRCPSVGLDLRHAAQGKPEGNVAAAGLTAVKARAVTVCKPAPRFRERPTMPRYISLLRFTDQGARELRRSTARAHQFDAAAAKAGVKITGQFWTLGARDGVLVTEAADDRAILHLLADLVTAGNVRPETMPAFTDAEFDAILRVS